MTDYTKPYETAGMVVEWAHLPTSGPGLSVEGTNRVRFKAFVTAFSESYSSDWNQQVVYGRMDPIETFKSTRRTINLAWTVIAYGPKEANENLKKVSKLVQFLYPTYTINPGNFGVSGFGILKAPPLLRLKFMNLIQSTRLGATTEGLSKFQQVSSAEEETYGAVMTSGLLGRTSGFNITHELDDGVVMDEGPIAAPKRISISCTFYPIHDHGLGWNATDNQFFSPAFPYGFTEDFPSTGGTTEIDQADMADLGETGGAPGVLPEDRALDELLAQK